MAIFIICGGMLLAGRYVLGFVREGPHRGALQGRETGGKLFAGSEAKGVHAEIPAPPGGELLFARPGANQDGSFYRYRTGVATKDVVAYYRKEMPQAGWREMTEFSQAYTREYQVGDLVYFVKPPNRQCYISVSESAVERATAVSVSVW
jgi:hypothetical protein